jgi:hypothetical protein
LPTMLRTFPSSIVKLAYLKRSRLRVCWWYASRLFLIANPPRIITLRSGMAVTPTILAATNSATHRRPHRISGIFHNPVPKRRSSGVSRTVKQAPSHFRSMHSDLFVKKTPPHGHVPTKPPLIP